MKHKSIFFQMVGIFLITVLISPAVLGQGVDFSGKWKLAPSKSKLNEQFSMAPKELVIVQNGNDLSIERLSEFQGQEYKSTTKLTLDGVECVNVGMMEMKIKSTATWSEDKNSLTVKSKIPMENSGEFSVAETYKMAGADLSIESSSSGDWGTSSETYVFEKKTE